MKNLPAKLSVLALVFYCSLHAQTSPKSGPLFQAYGKVYQVPEANFEKNATQPMKAVFDVSKQFSNRPGPNPLIETAARYYNLHLQNGYQSSQLKAAVVVHGKAVYDVLANTAYQEKFGKENPNAGLVTALIKQGVRVVLCGQSATYYGVQLDQSVPGTEMALSAMTALVHLQNEGYQLIHFQ